MALLIKKLKASTLLEALVAVIIIMVCFGIALSVFINVINTDNNNQKIKAHFLLNKLAIKIKADEIYDLQDEKEMDNDFLIHKSIRPYKNIENLYFLQLYAFDKQGKLLAEYKELIR